MQRVFGLTIVLLLLTLAACSGGGGSSNTSNSGLTPLDFDVTTDPGSSVNSGDVIGYAVEMVNPMFREASNAVPDGEAVVAVLKFEPETDPGEGFSGDFTVRTGDHSVSKVASAADGIVYRFVWDSRSQVWQAIRVGVYHHGTGGSFLFDLNFLGFVILTRPSGPQFSVVAFADLSQAQVDTEINFWAIAHGGEGEVTYDWSFGDGAVAKGDQVSHVYPVLGEYNVTLTATDTAGNVAPVASTPISIVANPVPLTEVDVVVTDNGDGSFRYSATLDGGTPPFQYEWDFDSDGDTDSTAGPNPTFIPATPGVYVFELVVTDQTGASASTSGIADGRSVSLSVDPNPAYHLTDVAFEVEAEGVDGTDTITIQFGDGASEAGVSLVHQFEGAGSYLASASVTRLVNGVALTKESEDVVVVIEARPAPRIDSVTPARAPAGTDITLAGEFFFLPEVGDEVLLNQVPMPVVTWGPDQIVVTVPQGARDGDIVVRKATGGLDSNPVPFDVAPGTPGEPGLGQL
jgi:PKD repeat protein